MADRYWVGGTGTWDESSTSHWSASSGGATGASVPTVSDAVFFNANSGSGTVTVNPTIPLYCASLDFTGFVGTFDSADSCVYGLFFVSGNVTLSSGGTYYVSAGSGGPGQGFGVIMLGTGTFTSVGKTINVLYTGDPSGSTPTTTTLGDNLSIQPGTNSGAQFTFAVLNGTFNANNFNIQAQDFITGDPGYGNSITINMGSGTWQLWDDGYGYGWNINFGSPITAGTLTINPGTSTIQMGSTSSAATAFTGGGYTYNNLTITGNVYGIYGNNTFNTIAGNYIAGTKTISFEAGSTQTVSNFTVSGSSGSLWTLNSTSPGTQFTLSKASGTVSLDYLSIQDSNATGGAAWYAGTNSTNVSNNTGWIFTAPPAPGGQTVTIGPGISLGAGVSIT
jgi:hypothetical protein